MLFVLLPFVLGALPPAAAWDVALVEPPSLLVGFPASTAFQQSQNPSFVPRSPLLPGGGLMVRLQNCTGPRWAGFGPTNHSQCNYGHGGGGDCYGDSGWVRDHVAFLPFAEGYTGSAPPRGQWWSAPAFASRPASHVLPHGRRLPTVTTSTSDHSCTWLPPEPRASI